MNIRGSTALVTGATAGIGRATAIALARAGARVIATGRDPQALAAIRDATGGTAVAADLADPADIEQLAAAALGEPAPVDILVNNAGIGWEGPFAAMPPDKIDDLAAVNLLGAVRLTRALLPSMLERGRGHIVNVASIAGHVGVRDEALYAATKAALLAFSEGLRYEVQQSGVRVSTVSPGVVDTEFFARRGSPFRRRRPRPIPPERVAEAIVRAIERERDEVVVPGWLRLPIWLHGVWPGLYRTLARRFG
ncbi:MAG: SDR family NAD(P)-dependent oxidoreductase [Chloroflexi bacterium]|nr:SDR family NAD(P)-dependent oxidoreductase [Chloroflexota bacterium]